MTLAYTCPCHFKRADGIAVLEDFGRRGSSAKNQLPVQGSCNQSAWHTRFQTPPFRQLHHLVGEHILVQILISICTASFILQNHNIIQTSRDLIMSQDYEFKGWMGLDEKAIGNMKWQSFEPKPWEETDIDILITHCGFATLRTPSATFI